MNTGSRNPIGLGLVIIGAAAMAIATFLPFTEPIGRIILVRNNTLIQHGGWILIALAVGIASSGYRVFQYKRTQWAVPVILSVIAGGLILFLANDKDLRTLYPVGPNGVADSSQPGEVATLGIAIYVAGAGAAAALAGSVRLRQSGMGGGEQALAEKATKKCPDCAEAILAAAKVCKHCGYRFAPASTSSPASPSPKPKPAKTTPPTRTNPFREGDRVQVVKPGHKAKGKTGKVVDILDSGFVAVRVGFWEYTFRPESLKRNPAVRG